MYVMVSCGMLLYHHVCMYVCVYVCIVCSVRPLQRMVVGMLLAGLAFMVAGFVDLRVQSVQNSLNEGESRLILYNNLPGDVSYQLEDEMDSNFSGNGILANGQVSHSHIIVMMINWHNTATFHMFMCLQTSVHLPAADLE